MKRAALLVVLALSSAGCIDAILTDEPQGPEESQDGSGNPTTTTTTTTTTTPPVPGTIEKPPSTTTSPASTTPTPPTTPPSPPPPSTSTPPPPSSTPPPPSSTPPPPAPWPREGSHVAYRVHVSQSFSGTAQRWTADANLTWTFRDGDWTGECVMQRHDDSDGDGVVEEQEVRATYTADSPPHWPPFNTRDPPAVGERVDTWYARGCTLDHDDFTYQGTGEGAFTVDGTPRSVAYHEARSDESDVPYVYKTRWSQATGLVLEWSLIRPQTQAPYSTSGTLVSTDATL